MGVYRKLVGNAQALNRRPEVEPTTKLYTPANAISAARIGLAVKAAHKLVHGEKYVLPWVVAATATDALDGATARWFDAHHPEWELGSSIYGAMGDIASDNVSLLVIAGGILRAPRVTKSAKLATTAILGQEGLKTVWYLHSNGLYKAATVSDEFPKGQRFVIPASTEGKESMVEKMVGIVCAAATNDFDSAPVRASLSIVAMGHAGVGVIRAEHERRHTYDPMFHDMLAALPQAA